MYLLVPIVDGPPHPLLHLRLQFDLMTLVSVEAEDLGKPHRAAEPIPTGGLAVHVHETDAQQQGGADMVDRDIVIYGFCAHLRDIAVLDDIGFGIVGRDGLLVVHEAATCHEGEEEGLPDLAQSLESASLVQLIIFLLEGRPMQHGC